MTPEQDIQQALVQACPNAGHWPYTKDAGVFIGYRPAGDRLTWAGNKTIVSETAYDVVIYHRLGYAEDAEQMRFDVYAALHENGWLLDDEPGPESYVANMELFAWPLTVRKRFYIRDGVPITPDDLRRTSSTG